MKFFQIFSLVLFVALSGCSTAMRGSPSRPIGLTDLEGLRPGQATARELKEALGEPGQTIALSATEESWIYREPHGPSYWQRASFTVDKTNGSILASVLLLNDSDPLHDLGQAIRHFETSRFTIKGEGWIKGHEYSDNADYSDPVNGISMTVRRARKTVSEISFWLPSSAHAPLAEQRKSL